MVKLDMQMLILQQLFTEACSLKDMPQRWRDDHKDRDSNSRISRMCGCGTMDKGAADHFNWMGDGDDDEYDYCERQYDGWGVLYECEIYQELEEKCRNLQAKYKRRYPNSEVSVDIDGFKCEFKLDVKFELSDIDFQNEVKKLEEKKTTTKTKKTGGNEVMSERGKEIVTWLQGQPVKSYSAREIAEGLFCSSRAIPGAMRKLQDDGFIKVEKVGTAPNQYKLTELGQTVVVNA